MCAHRVNTSVDKRVIAGVTVATLAGALAVFVLPAVTSVASPGPAGTVYVTDFTNSQVVPVAAGASSPGAPIALAAGTAPVGIEITNDASRAYVADSQSDQVSPVTLSSQTVGNPIAVDPADPGAANPQYLAISPDSTQALVANEDAGTVTPINLTTNQPGTPYQLGSGSGPVAVAYTPSGNTAFVANFENGTVTPINLSRGAIGTPIHVGGSPAALSITPDGKTLYVANEGSGSVTPVTVATDTAGAAIQVGASPDGIAITPDGKTAYVANFDDSTITPIDLGTGSAEAVISLEPDTFPSAVAVSPDGSTVYVPEFGTGGLAVVSTATNAVLRTVQIGGSPIGVAVSPDQGATAMLSVTAAPAGSPTQFDASASTKGSSAITNYHYDFGDGSSIDSTSPTVTHVYATAGSYSATVTVTDSAGTSTTSVYTGQMTLRNGSAVSTATVTAVVLSPTAGASPIAYVANFGTSNVTPVATAPAVLAGSPISVRSNPKAIAITPDGAKAYAVDSGDGTVVPINLSANLAGTAIAVGNEPNAIAITPDATQAYVANEGSASLSVITLRTGSVRTIALPAGSEPDAVAIDPSGTWAYIADLTGNGVIPVKLVNSAVGAEVTTGSASSPTALAVSPDGTHLYIAATGSDSVRAMGIGSAGLGALTASVSLGSGNDPSALAIAPDGSEIYVAAKASAKIVALSLPSLSTTAVTSLVGGRAPTGIGITPDGTTALVAESGSNQAISLTLPSTPGSEVKVGNNPDAVAVTPDQAPIASLSVTPGLAASATEFDASASSAPSSPIASYAWDFGDGHTTTTTSATTEHTYAKPGDYTASVVLTDVAGTSTTQVFTGQTVTRNGGADAKTSQTFHVYAPPPTVDSLSPQSGPVGQQVTITGTWLYFATVTFGGVPVPAADVTVSDDGTSLIVAAPPGPALNAAQDVVVTTPGPTGPQSVVAGQFTYLSGLSSPVVTTLTPDAGPAGTSVAITGSALDGATVMFGSKSATITANTASEVDVTAPSGAGTVPVIVTDAHGTVGAGRFTYTGGTGAPKITGLSPSSGVAGDSVTISGSALSAADSVTFAGFPAHIVSTTAKKIVVTAPAGSGAESVVVTAASKSSLAGTFAYTTGTPAPSATVINPVSGAPGDSVTITGDNLDNAVVDFGGVQAKVTRDSSTSIVVTVPAGVGIDTVTVVTPGGRSAAGTFDYAPTISELSPTHGVAGTSVTLTGANLGNASAVTFDGAAATITSDTATKLVVKAPAGTAGSDATVVVSTPGGDVTATATFHYDAAAEPTITGLSPTDGKAGTVVTLVGANLGNATAVTFDGVSATITSDTATKIVVKAPAGTAGNDATVVVSTPGGDVTAASTFHYNSGLEPTITGLSPTHGAVGTLVTLKGKNLADVTSVTFQGTDAPIVFDLATRVIVRAPAAAVGTDARVVVTTPGGSVTATTQFHYDSPRKSAATKHQRAGDIPETGARHVDVGPAAVVDDANARGRRAAVGTSGPASNSRKTT